MTQKVLKVGSSAAVTIPKKSLQELGFKIGDRVYVFVDAAKQRVIVSKRKDFTGVPPEDLEILKWTKRFIAQYRKDLMALAKK